MYESSFEYSKSINTKSQTLFYKNNNTLNYSLTFYNANCNHKNNCNYNCGINSVCNKGTYKSSDVLDYYNSYNYLAINTNTIDNSYDNYWIDKISNYLKDK